MVPFFVVPKDPSPGTESIDPVTTLLPSLENPLLQKPYES